MEGAAEMLELQSRAWRKHKVWTLQSFITQLPPLFKQLFQTRNEEPVKIIVKILIFKPSWVMQLSLEREHMDLLWPPCNILPWPLFADFIFMLF